MNENLEKVKAIFKSPSLAGIIRWSKPVHWAVFGIGAIAVFSSLLSLGETLVLKSLIDGATSSNLKALWFYGALLVAIVAVERLSSIASAYIYTK